MANKERTEQWYLQYGESVHRRCLRITGDPTLAWDLTQEVFVRAHRYGDELRDASKALAWLLTIADRCSLTALRQRQAQKLQPLADELQPAPQKSSEQVLIEGDLLRRIIPRFDDTTQRIVLLYFLDGLKHEDIAMELAISRKTVHRKLERFYVQARKYAGRGAA